MAVFPAFGPGAEVHSLTTNEGVTMRVVRRARPPVVFIPGGDADGGWILADLRPPLRPVPMHQLRSPRRRRDDGARPRHGAWRITPATAPP
jgi:hypothetical protein